MVLFGTGGETHGGSLWVISMMDLLHADDSKVRVRSPHMSDWLSPISLYFPILPYTSLYFPILPYTSLYFPILPYTSLYFPILPYTSLYFPILPYTSLYFPGGSLWVISMMDLLHADDSKVRVRSPHMSAWLSPISLYFPVFLSIRLSVGLSMFVGQCRDGFVWYWG